MHCFCCDLTSALVDTKQGFGWPLSHRYNYELGLGWALKETEVASTGRWCFPLSGPRRKEHTAGLPATQPIRVVLCKPKKQRPHNLPRPSISMNWKPITFWAPRGFPQHRGCLIMLHGQHIPKKVFPFGLGPVAKVVDLNTQMALFPHAKHKTRNWAMLSEFTNSVISNFPEISGTWVPAAIVLETSSIFLKLTFSSWPCCTKTSEEPRCLRSLNPWWAWGQGHSALGVGRNCCEDIGRFHYLKSSVSLALRADSYDIFPSIKLMNVSR